MANVIGLGGLFFKSANPAALREWYSQALGLAFDEWGGLVFEPAVAAAHPGAGTVFCPFEASTDYFAPSAKDFMFNLIVDDLDAMLARCADHSVAPVGKVLDEFNGRFAHIMDPEGHKIELWEPRS